eukprot:TRINITY_DN107771_c0_g1_i1.p2 TRINITY_DN107771_c0_g1~~TRINITY_DN107771_c0_g1_i1.p2  ORF type:complete len:184 (-),score=17.84 TRINITY_DN107771_c0_g1_i1:159-710(-)
MLHELHSRSGTEAILEDYTYFVSVLHAQPIPAKSEAVHAIINDPNTGEEQIVQWQQGKFPTWEESIREMRESVQRSIQYMQSGQGYLVRDLLAWEWAQERCFHMTALCVGLLDRYFLEAHSEDRCMLARTDGCTNCGSSCLGPSAVRCSVCENAFWCCDRCMREDSHELCPGRPVVKQLQIDL